MEFLNVLAGLRTPLGDAFFQLCTYLGQDIPILAIICILYWGFDKTLAYQTALSFFTSGLLVQNLKITFRVPRPWVLDPGFQAVPSAVPAATGYSFPSGHTQSAAALYGNLAASSRRRSLKILFTALLLLVGFSRMYLGCHTPQDVAAALLLGLASTAAVRALFRRLRGTHRENLILGCVLAVCSLLTAVYGFSLLSGGVINADNAADAIKSAGAGLGFAVGYYVERSFLSFSTDLPLSGKVKRCLLGLLLVLLLKVLLGLLLGNSLLLQMVEYAILILFILVLYPLTFCKAEGALRRQPH